MGVFGISIGKSVEYLSSEYTKTVEVPEVWNGSRADLEDRINKEVETCQNKVRGQNGSISRANAKSNCDHRIRSKYAALVENAVALTKFEEDEIRARALEGKQKTYMAVGLGLLLLLGIVLIIKK